MPAISPSVLIVRLDAIGDALALTPLIAALREHGASVDTVLNLGNAHAFSQRALDRVFIAGTADLAHGLVEQHYTHALIATEDARGYRIARDARIPQRVGFHNGWGKPLKSLWARTICTSTVYRPAGLDPRGPHECDVLYELGRSILGPLARPSRDAAILRPLVINDEPVPDERISLQITSKWLRLGASIDELVELARSAGSLSEVRMFGAHAEGDFLNSFERASGARVERFADLPQWKSAIAAAALLIAPDSGALHVAGMTGTPVVACFEAIPKFDLQTARWAPWAARNAIVKLEGAWPSMALASAAALLTDRRPIDTA